MSARRYSSVMEPFTGTELDGSEEGTPKLGLKVWVGVCERRRWQDWYVQC